MILLYYSLVLPGLPFPEMGPRNPGAELSDSLNHEMNPRERPEQASSVPISLVMIDGSNGRECGIFDRLFRVSIHPVFLATDAL